MIRSSLARPFFVLGLASSLIACGGETAEDAPATDAATSAEADVIEVRQKNFEEIGDAFKAIRGQLETDAPDLAVIEANAGTINANAQLITDYFPEGTGVDSGADTEALKAIWEKPDEFAAAAQKLVDTSAALAAAAASQDPAAVAEGVKNMGGSCKACHDVFRLDDD